MSAQFAYIQGQLVNMAQVCLVQAWNGWLVFKFTGGKSRRVKIGSIPKALKALDELLATYGKDAVIIPDKYESPDK